MNIQPILNTNCFVGRDGLLPHYIILHGTAGGNSAQSIANYFASTQGSSNPVSSHYVVGQDGNIIRCNNEQDGAWSNGYLSRGHDAWWNPSVNPNNITISIEHVKPAQDNSDNLTAPQQAASFALIRDICTRWNIPARAADATGGITGHYSIDPVNRSRCPGPYPWTELWTFLKGGNMIPAGWHDNGTTLTAPNGHNVIQGFRAFVLANTWDPDNWPLEEEHPQTPLEIGNPALGNGTQQIFRWLTLEWSSQQPNATFIAWSGQETLALRAQVASLQTQLQQAQNGSPDLQHYKDLLNQINTLSKI